MIYHHIRQKKNNIPKYSEFSPESGEKRYSYILYLTDFCNAAIGVFRTNRFQ